MQELTKFGVEVLMRLMEDCPAFCCSFQEQPVAQDAATDGNGSEQVLASPNPDLRMVSEVSAFELDEEMKEEENVGDTVKPEELSNKR